MKKKLCLLIVFVLLLCLTACNERKRDCIEVYNKSHTIFDNINIEVKDGYFYDSHAKFEVDENTVCVAILFTKDGTPWKQLEVEDNVQIY